MSKEKKFASTPAPYAASTVPESKSIHILLGLLEEKFIKADIKTSDKVPNIDGTIEITDVNQVPQGKVEVQIKTLSKKKGAQTHQCHGNFLAYCKLGILPVILIAVDATKKIAYWVYMDENTIEDAENRATGETVAISFPDENIINGSNLSYIDKWTAIIQGRREKVYQYDALKSRMDNVDKFLVELSEKFEPAISLPAYDLISIQKFLDCLNFILDHEFRIVKERIYPNYWKIGMAVIKFEKDVIEFILHPIKYADSKPLIMKLKKGTNYDMHEEYMNDNFIMMVSRGRARFNRDPWGVAYELIDSQILQFTKQNNLPLNDEFIAVEYLFGFLEEYKSVFGFDPETDTFPIEQFQYVLFNLIPVYASRNVSAAPGVTEISSSIDTYERWGRARVIRAFSKAEEAIKQGYIPEYKVTVTSRQYDMKLVRYFLDAMSGKQFIKRKYRFGKHHFGERHNKMNWNDEMLIDALGVFWSSFYQIYIKFINQHYPFLKDVLKLLNEGQILVVQYVHLDNGSKSLELYFVQMNRVDLPKIVFYDFASSDAPIDRRKVLKENIWEFRNVLGHPGRVKLLRAFPLDFLLEASPTYHVINFFLNEKIENYFKAKIKAGDPFEYV